ncbi:MAG: GerW family sporulation protein [Eubacterium sp.]|nr:GerW family sporulation protein [Eubacterium sp.]
MADKNTGVSVVKTVNNLFDGMDGFLSAKTVVGEPIKVNDTTLIPLVDVSFGIGAGAIGKTRSDNAFGGLGGKMSPTAVMVIKNGFVQILPVHDDSSLASVMNKIPGLVDKVTDVIKSRKDSSVAQEKQEIDNVISDLKEEEF